MVWEDEKLELLQIHFHHPSELTVNGKTFPMGIHFVHSSGDHVYVVIGVFSKYRKLNDIIRKLWKDIPTQIDKETLVKDHLIDAGALFADSKEYFLYNGSLTTSPFSGNVTWFIFEEPIKLSKKKVKNFESFIDRNSRPVQKKHH